MKCKFLIPCSIFIVAFTSAGYSQSLHNVAEVLIKANVIDVKVKGEGFVPVTPVPEPTESASPEEGKPPAELLKKVPTLLAGERREYVPVYSVHLTFEVLEIVEYKSAYPKLIQVGNKINVEYGGLPKQPEYRPGSTIKIKMRLVCNNKKPYKATFSVWQVLETIPAIDAETQPTLAPFLNIAGLKSELQKKVEKVQDFIQKAFLQGKNGWALYNGLVIPDAGQLIVEIKGGKMLCLICGAPIDRGAISIADETMDFQSLHDFAFHNKPVFTKEQLDLLFEMARYLKELEG